MADTDPDRELDRLIAGHLDDALSTADAELLHRRLRSEPAARGLLLAAARQASAWSHLSARPVARRAWRHRTIGLAVAACLIAAVSTTWFVLAGQTPVLRSDGAGVVLRTSTPVAGTWLESGDELRTGVRPTVLTWTDEATRIELAPQSVCVVERDRGSKRLRLDRGSLRADVAHQQAGAGLAIITPFGTVDVVGTRFTVQVGSSSSQVSVDQGVVGLRSTADTPVVQLQAGYTATLDARQISRPSPRLQLPVPPGPTVTTAVGPDITAQDWIAVHGAGWEGGLGEGGVLTSAPADPDWSRLMTPAREAPGYARFSDRMTCRVTVTVDNPTTLALVLVIGGVDDSIWRCNLQAEQPIRAGTSTVSFRVTDMHRVAGMADERPKDGIVNSLALMSWNPRTDFAVTRIEFDSEP